MQLGVVRKKATRGKLGISTALLRTDGIIELLSEFDEDGVAPVADALANNSELGTHIRDPEEALANAALLRHCHEKLDGVLVGYEKLLSLARAMQNRMQAAGVDVSFDDEEFRESAELIADALEVEMPT